jgi:hypothetical protein
VNANLVWSIDSYGRDTATFQGRAVGGVERRDKPEWIASINAPDFRHRQFFSSREHAIEWVESEWREFVLLVIAAAAAPAPMFGNGGW